MLATGAVAGFVLRSLWQARGARDEVRDTNEETSQNLRDDERFDALVRALPLGVIMIDSNSRVRYANRAAGNIFGFNRRRVRGRHIIEAIPSIELEQRVGATLRGEPAGGPMILSGKAANRDYAISMYPLTAQDDSVNGALMVAEDQTELLALERARQEFLTNVSHELRTPLTSVKLMLETVLTSDEDEARDLFLPQALNEVDRLASLVQRLLEQARTQSGVMVINPAETDLESVVRPIVQSFEPNAAEKDVALEFSALRPVRLQVDAERFSQVVVNLVDNAIKFTQPGGNIVVETDAEGADAIVRVRDTGAGIPYKDLPHVFERFYVADRSRARGLSGAGLGLSIARQIAEAHRGAIEVQSMLGVGTVFTVRVPILQLFPET
ncbi:MAG: PAS domain-containing protein [Candidatus Eremiobacteraeota bacterium]|nr:PAS domain-containing protein [Candidatus Eremiobacteraeota bacterium]